MGFLKILFRAATRSTRQNRRRSKTFVAPEQKPKQFYSPPPIPDLEKVRHQNDIDPIQALPLVKVEHVIDGDTVIVSTDTSEVRIRLDSIDCPEDGQEWGDIATRG